jgi:hypothetical protein
MADVQNVVDSIREDATQVLEAMQGACAAAVQDKDDFVAEEGVQWFQDWFNSVQGYDITFQDMVDGVGALETLKATWDTVRAKIQILRTR